MAIRQYIGARYVPKFMGTYDPTQVYEALDVVDNGLGTSYISKIPTPAGTPLTNTTYWAIYGATSGAIINLQNQIDDMNDGSVPGSLQAQINNINVNEIPALQDDVAELQLIDDGHILLVFDSYGTTYGNPAGDTRTIPGMMPSYTNRTIRSIAASGSGFVRDTGNGTFYANLVNYINTSTNLDKISEIWVCAGRNDWTATAADLDNAIQTFYDYAAANLPNLRRKRFGYIANGDNNAVHGTRAQQYTCYNNFKDSCNAHGIDWIPGVDCVLHDYTLLLPDGVHPSIDGKIALAKALAASINDTYVSQGVIKHATWTAETGITIVNYNSDILSQMCGNISSIQFPLFIVIGMSAAISSSLTTLPIFKIDNSYFKYPMASIPLPAKVMYEDSTTHELHTLASNVYLTADGTVTADIYATSGDKAKNITQILLISEGVASNYAAMV